ncbi:MAG: Na+/H+ antiporter NhaA [Bacteroidales bacterium]|jgi:NhaA family Na+:H+ antiporter|nr:Na+/H+ antiporter NhaA [Bacteroidales bacterium]MCU0409179.1 Na+/H+ antiporter NhaA [Bacteroidales bacterium]
MKLTGIFRDFFRKESTAGILLIVITIATLLMVNLVLHESFTDFWKKDLLGKPLEFWINDVLMTFFFLLVGLEIEREIYKGELSEFRQALLPIMAAAGGMLVPAAIYLSLNLSSGSLNGFGIPMATDIAFSLTVLTILASRIPSSLKIFLTALAIIDDLGAILIIAVFYTKEFSLIYLGSAIALLAMMIAMNRSGVRRLAWYALPAVLMWICIYKAGIHPTISGVLFAFVVPFGNGDENSPSHRLETRLHVPVAYFILPLFAVENTGIILEAADFQKLFNPVSLGIILGLVLGKPAGIFLFSWLGVKTGLCSMFEDLKWRHIAGAGMIAGIGFTMSIFISLLAFDDPAEIKAAKLAVLIASVIAATAGYLYLRFSCCLNPENEDNKDSGPSPEAGSKQLTNSSLN